MVVTFRMSIKILGGCATRHSFYVRKCSCFGTYLFLVISVSMVNLEDMLLILGGLILRALIVCSAFRSDTLSLTYFSLLSLMKSVICGSTIPITENFRGEF